MENDTRFPRVSRTEASPVRHGEEAKIVIKEAADQVALLRAVHSGFDQLVENLPDGDWTVKPGPEFNSVAAIVEHVALVERRFASLLADSPEDVDAGSPFRAAEWDVAAVRQAFADGVQRVEEACSNLSADDMEQPGAKLRLGELNKRQLLSYLIAHTDHHRGQIPIVLKLLKRG